MSACLHAHTHFDPLGWPTGEDLEVCDDCGASRTHWEQGRSDWLSMERIMERRKVRPIIPQPHPGTVGGGGCCVVVLAIGLIAWLLLR